MVLYVSLLKLSDILALSSELFLLPLFCQNKHLHFEKRVMVEGGN